MWDMYRYAEGVHGKVGPSMLKLQHATLMALEADFWQVLMMEGPVGLPTDSVANT